MLHDEPRVELARGDGDGERVGQQRGGEHGAEGGAVQQQVGQAQPGRQRGDQGVQPRQPEQVGDGGQLLIQGRKADSTKISINWPRQKPEGRVTNI